MKMYLYYHSNSAWYGSQLTKNRR